MDITKTEVLKAKPGDILWISLHGSTTTKEAYELANVLSSIIPRGVIPLITFDNIVAHARVSSVEEIRHYRNKLDEIISSWQLSDEYDD